VVVGDARDSGVVLRPCNVPMQVLGVELPKYESHGLLSRQITVGRSKLGLDLDLV
jgi:hypothetical protein